MRFFRLSDSIECQASRRIRRSPSNDRCSFFEVWVSSSYEIFHFTPDRLNWIQIWWERRPPLRWDIPGSKCLLHDGRLVRRGIILHKLQGKIHINTINRTRHNIMAISYGTNCLQLFFPEQICIILLSSKTSREHSFNILASLIDYAYFSILIDCLFDYTNYMKND